MGKILDVERKARGGSVHAKTYKTFNHTEYLKLCSTPVKLVL